MIIKGEIILYSKDGVVCKSKRFNNKSDRNSIIEGWEKFYKLSRKPFYYISVHPNLSDLPLTIAGYISLYIDKSFVDDMLYNDIWHRKTIIEKWISKNKLINIDYILNIVPLNIIINESD
jgi:hypothetical protein